MLALAWSRLNFRPTGPTTQALAHRIITLLNARFPPAPLPPSADGPSSGAPGPGPSTTAAPAATARAAAAASARQQQQQPAPEVVVSPQSVANLCHALHATGLHHANRRLAPALAAACAALMPQFNLVELGEVGLALAGMDTPSSPSTAASDSSSSSSSSTASPSPSQAPTSPTSGGKGRGPSKQVRGRWTVQCDAPCVSRGCSTRVRCPAYSFAAGGHTRGGGGGGGRAAGLFGAFGQWGWWPGDGAAGAAVPRSRAEAHGGAAGAGAVRALCAALRPRGRRRHLCLLHPAAATVRGGGGRGGGRGAGGPGRRRCAGAASLVRAPGHGAAPAERRGAHAVRVPAAGRRAPAPGCAAAPALAPALLPGERFLRATVPCCCVLGGGGAHSS